RVSITKAVSAATRRAPTGPLPSEEEVSVLLSLGMPVVVSGAVVGGIGISAGTEAQDEEVARAALKALW
ncbi:MAG: heme-binding protein, partial [Acidobacteria bacterium]|nr:heme-binding protein [Acidobacteriota bacterium]